MSFTQQDWDAWDAAFPEVDNVVKEATAAAPVTINITFAPVTYNIIQTAISNGSTMPAPRMNLIDAPRQSYAEKLGAAYQADPNYGKRPMEDWEHKMLKSQSSWGG